MEKETSRVEAFSDGVFGIALTLLILGIKVPDLNNFASNDKLFRSLINLWPSYFAFILSFTAVLNLQFRSLLKSLQLKRQNRLID